MSYLLEALKKAEEERLSLKEDLSPQLTAVQLKPSVLPVWLIAIIVSLLVITVWKLFVYEVTSNSEEEGLVNPISKRVATSVISDRTTGPVSKKALYNSNPSKEYRLNEGDIIIKPDAVVSSDGVSINNIGTHHKGEGVLIRQEAKQLAELTKNELSRIPNLSLESHLFSSVAKYSSVVINGGTYAEGDYINSEIIIKKISAKGIILSLGDLLVELPKGITWVSNNHVK